MKANQLRLRLGDPVPSQIRGGIVAIGNFDGVHRGHQALLTHAAALGAQMQRPVMALTFSPHPHVFFGKTDGWFPLTDDHREGCAFKSLSTLSGRRGVRRPGAVGLPPRAAVVHLRARLRRDLRADDPGQPERDAQRRLRAHGQGEKGLGE